MALPAQDLSRAKAFTAIDGTVQTTVPASTAFAPVDLKVYFLRPVPPDGRDLVARGNARRDRIAGKARADAQLRG